MLVINIVLISTCVALAISLITLIWRIASYKNLLDGQVKQNRAAIVTQGRNFRYAYRLLENDLFDIQGFLVKTTDYKIRARAEISGNSGADFLEESEKDNNNNVL